MDNNNESDQFQSYAHRVIATLNREQVDFLDKIGKDAQFSSGNKLSRTQILAAMVNAFQKLYISGENINSIEEFEQRIIEAIRSGKMRSDQNDS